MLLFSKIDIVNRIGWFSDICIGVKYVQFVLFGINVGK